MSIGARHLADLSSVAFVACQITRSLLRIHDRMELAAEEAQVPPQALLQLPRGAELVWTLSVLLPDGRRLPPVAFLVRLE